MKNSTAETENEMAAFASEARVLLAATADAAEEKVVEARKRVSAALDRGRELYSSAREMAKEGAECADARVRAHPYEAAVIAFGLGAVLGCLLVRRN